MLLNILFVLAIIWLSISITSCLYSAYWLYTWFADDTSSLEVSDDLSQYSDDHLEQIAHHQEMLRLLKADDSSDIPF